MVLERRDKIGFQTPESHWLREAGDWITSVLGGSAARDIPALRAEAAVESWAAVRDGRAPFDATLWRTLNVIRWAEQTGARFH